MLGDVPLGDIPLASLSGGNLISRFFSYVHSYFADEKKSVFISKEAITSFSEKINKSLDITFSLLISGIGSLIKSVERTFKTLNAIDVNAQKLVLRYFYILSTFTVNSTKQLMKMVFASVTNFISSNFRRDITLTRTVQNNFGIRFIKSVFKFYSTVNLIINNFVREIFITRTFNVVYSISSVFSRFKYAMYSVAINYEFAFKREIEITQREFNSILTKVHKLQSITFPVVNTISVNSHKFISRTYSFLQGIFAASGLQRYFIDFSKYYDLYISFNNSERRLQKMIEKFSFYDKIQRFRVLLK